MCRLSLVAATKGYSLVAVFRLPIAVASLVPGHGLQRPGSAVVAHGVSCPLACETVTDQGLNLNVSPALVGGFLTTGLPGKSMGTLFSLTSFSQHSNYF